MSFFLWYLYIFYSSSNKTPDHYTTTVSDSYCILHCYFHWISWMNAFFIIIVPSFSNGSLSGALLVYPATTQKALCPVRLKEGLCMWWAPHIMLHLPNWKANSIIHVTDRKTTFHKLFLFEVLILFWFMKNSNAEARSSRWGVKPSCVELSVSVHIDSQKWIHTHTKCT